MNDKLFYILVFLLTTAVSYGQNDTARLQGKVTFVTSRNVYVKFENTDRIAIGDTLHFSKENSMTACLVVGQKSSSSCVCSIINDCEVALDDMIVFEYVPAIETPKEEEKAPSVEELLGLNRAENPGQNSSNEVIPAREQKIRGRISAATYSSMSQNGDDRHRMMYRFSLNASNINQSKFSVESYLNYRQNFISSAEPVTQQTKFFRVYNLAVRYDVDSTLSLTLGRKINNKASSLGAIDGLQAEKRFGNMYVGVIGGFRPDIIEYNLNTSLLQYGAYFGHGIQHKNIYAQTTFGLLEQRNTGQIDRRYMYFQHSSTIGRKLNLFGSVELDIYDKINEVTSSTMRLTNLYVSARYRFNRKINLSVAYDARKRILFYETFKTKIEQLLDDDLTRQGLRFRINVKPMKYMNVGASYSKRFQSDQQNKSDNINGFVSYSKMPKIGGRMSFNFNLNNSNYLQSRVISLRYSRSLIAQKLNADFYARWVNYQYVHSRLNTDTYYYGTSFSYRINRQLTLSLLGELASRLTEQNYRVNFKVIKRFGKK